MCPGTAAVVTAATVVATTVPRRTPAELAVPAADRLRRVVEQQANPITVLGIRSAMGKVDLQALAATVAAAVVAVVIEAGAAVAVAAAAAKEDSDRLEMAPLTALATIGIENVFTGVLNPISISK